MEHHNEEVKKITIEVQQVYSTKEKFTIHHGPSKPSSNGSQHIVDTTDLNNVLRVDLNDRVAVVEANVTMDMLLEETLKHDLMPAMLKELPNITVGAAFSCAAGGSSSFKYGSFGDTVAEIEMILGNGEVITCSEKENADIFKGVAGALGTLGIVTLLTVRLENAFRYVEVTYRPFKGAKEAMEMLQALSTRQDSSIDFLDGIAYSATKSVVVTGRLTDSNPTGLPIQRFVRPKDPWYFKHAESRIDSSPLSPTKELMPVPDYLLRYNRGVFWLGEKELGRCGMSSSRYVRRLFRQYFTARVNDVWLQARAVSTMDRQDLVIPFFAAEKFLEWLDQRFGMYPLWLCPLRSTPTSALLNIDSSGPMLNIGIYDNSK